MSIREDAFARSAEGKQVDFDGVEVDRLEWMDMLRSVPAQKEADVNQMIADLLMGSENSGAARVICNRWQVRKVCELTAVKASAAGGES